MIKSISILLQNQKILIGAALTVILVYFLPFIIYGENSQILIHDNLDSNVAWVKMLLDNSGIFASPDYMIEQPLGGLSRSNLHGTYDFGLIWFKMFGVYWGYIANKIVMSLIAFLGMFLVLKKHFIKDETKTFISAGVALIFALLPFWSFTLSVSGLPIFLYAFLNIRKGEFGKLDWVILALIPFYSSLVLSGLFLLLILTMLMCLDAIREKKINYKFLLALSVASICYLISHYPLVHDFLFNSEFVSQRTEIVYAEVTFTEGINRMIGMFEDGQYHAASLHTFFYFPLIVVIIYGLVKKTISIRITLLLLFLVVSSFIYGFIHWNKIADFTHHLMTVLPIQLDRFHFLNPMFWYILLGIGLFIVSKKVYLGNLIAGILILFQLGYVFQSHEFITEKDKPSFSEFYAENQFNEIRDFIGQPADSYRVVSVGFHPSIAQYNGFYTLDGYFPNYSLAYKHKFRKVISSELERDEKLKNYFDTWGGRCYAFSAEMGLNFIEPQTDQIDTLAYNLDALNEMGGEYILSSVSINTDNSNGLSFLNKFEDDQSAWTIHLYELNSELAE